MKPTVIGDAGKEEKRPLRPTAMPSAPMEKSADPPRKPTVILAGKTAEPSVPVRATSVRAPTAIPGHVRKRISVSEESLKSRNPASSDAVLAKAKGLVESFDPDNDSERAAFMWGHELQVRYGQLVNECLSLGQSDAIAKTNTNVSRMLSILESIDLKAICGLGEKEGFFARISNKATGRVSSSRDLRGAMDELNQIVQILERRYSGLLSLKESLSRVSQEIDGVGNDIEAAAIAAAFVADYLGENAVPASPLKDRFSERSMSLIQTLAQIRESASARKMQIDQPIGLIETVQQVALVSVPGLLSSISSIKSMLESSRKRPTVTDVDEVSDQIGKIVEKLKN